MEHAQHRLHLAPGTQAKTQDYTLRGDPAGRVRGWGRGHPICPPRHTHIRIKRHTRTHSDKHNTRTQAEACTHHILPRPGETTGHPHLEVKVIAVVRLVEQLQQQHLHLVGLQACGQGEAQGPVQKALERREGWRALQASNSGLWGHCQGWVPTRSSRLKNMPFVYF